MAQNGHDSNGKQARRLIEWDHDYSKAGFTTRAIHQGQDPEPVTGAVVTPITLATTFAQYGAGQHTGYEYSRTGNPTRISLEKSLASLENAKYCSAFSSGSGATTTLMHLLKAGDHVVSIDDVYGGTNRYFNKVASRTNNFTFDFVDITEPEKLKEAMTKKKTAMVWMEAPTNPMLKIADIAKVCEIVKSINPECIVVSDNTFASPYIQNPLDLGADVVYHSCSKYINGHADVIMGVIMTNSQDIDERVKFLQNGLGAIPGPFDSYMCQRGSKTLALRMERHSASALELAKILEASDKVKHVFYPFLESHPQYKVAKKQMRLGGGMITVVVKGGMEAADRFLKATKVFILAESLGGVESLAEHPASMTHAAVAPEERAKLGIDDGLIRLSVGIEDIEDLRADIETALAAV